MEDKRVVDLDKLLQDTGLTLTIGGKDYLITDVPVAIAARASQRDPEKPDAEADWRMVQDVLASACADDASRGELIASLGKLGLRGRHAVTISVMDFFAPSDLVNKLPISPSLKAALLQRDGSEPSLTT